MRLRMDRAAAFLRGGDDGVTDLAGVIELDAAMSADGGRLEWSIGNSSAAPVSVRAVGWIVPIECTGPVRMFANGYQSWAPTGVVTLGVDRDPSQSVDAFELYSASMHADQRPTIGDELRSEQICALADDGRLVVVVGWLGGTSHDGTFRLRTGDRGPELVIEAHLGGAVMAGGAQRSLHPVSVQATERGGLAAALDTWASAVAIGERARASAPYQVGWCSWYHYFAEINQDALLANLALADDWPFDVFQLDDGFQPNIGDWLHTNDKFGAGIEEIAAAIDVAGRRPGIWIAPFLAHPDSEVHRAHPDWIARMPDGSGPLPGGINEIWNGIVNVLDTSNPAVIEHLESVAGSLVDAGYTYLKLDFTYSPSYDGIYHDPSMTPAERVRAGYDAIRRGAGDDVFILGCGAPLGSVVGVVDGMRIGPDVAPRWEVGTEEWAPEGYREQLPSTRNAWRSTLARSFMHRRLWLNDPDCLMLRTDETELTADQARAWAQAIAASGGMALVSDDLSLLDASARSLLDEVIQVGRAVDEVAALGRPPVCDDLLEHRTPHQLSSAVASLLGDPNAGTAELTQRP